jgi:ATP-dependent DNA ligase
MQLRVDGGKAVMRTRKGLDWTANFAAVADAGRGLPDCIIDGEVCALDRNGAPDFAALQAALSESRSQDPTYFFRPAVRRRRRSTADAADGEEREAQEDVEPQRPA